MGALLLWTSPNGSRINGSTALKAMPHLCPTATYTIAMRIVRNTSIRDIRSLAADLGAGIETETLPEKAGSDGVSAKLACSISPLESVAIPSRVILRSRAPFASIALPAPGLRPGLRSRWRSS
jgi:hypothetical protein